MEARAEQVEGLTRSQKIWWNIQRPLWELSILNRSKLFRLLSLLAFFSGMVSSGDQNLLIYYLEERLSFNDKDVAKMFLIIGLLGIFSQAVVLKPLIQFIGERWVVTLCFILSATDNFMYGVATTKRTIFVAMSISAFTNMAFPTISAIKANNVVRFMSMRIEALLCDWCERVCVVSFAHSKSCNFSLVNNRKNLNRDEFKVHYILFKHWRQALDQWQCGLYIILPKKVHF